MKLWQKCVVWRNLNSTPQNSLTRPFSSGKDAQSKVHHASPSPNSVPKCIALTVEDFMSGYYETNTPVLIQGMMETWRSRKWSVQSLKERIGHVEVPVELARWNKGEGRWGDYRDPHKATNIQADGEFGPCFSPHTPMSLADFMDVFMDDSVDTLSSRPLIGYIAQHQLLREVPELAADLPDPDYVKAQTEVYMRNIWLGPSGTVSPLHYDPYHNILAQIWGSKYVRLYCPQESAKLYPCESNLFLRNTSQVNVEGADTSKDWPEFGKAEYWECELQAGEMLYIPLKWWHYVRAKENSLSVSFWWL